MRIANPKFGCLYGLLRVAALLVVASFVAVGWILVSGSRSGGGSKLHSPARSPLLGNPGDGQTASRTVSKQIGRFEIFQHPSARLPAKIRELIQAKPGIDASLAHRLPMQGHAAFWTVPGNGFLCILIEQEAHSVSSVCSTTGEALTHGVSITLLDPRQHRRTIVGVAPDGPRKAILQSDGITSVARIGHGMFVHRDSLMAPLDRVLLR